MHDLEDGLRAAFSRQVSSAPPAAGLADTVLRRGRRVRRLRGGLGAGAGVAAAAALALLLPSVSLPSLPTTPAAVVPTGPPGVPLWAGQSAGSALYDWPAGERRARLADAEVLPHAVVDGGVLLTAGTSLALLGPDEQEPRVLLDGLSDPRAAVASGGGRATVVADREGVRELVEVALPSGSVLRTLPLAPPLLGAGEPVVPAAYSGQAVLLTLGEGDRQRSALWEDGPDQVVGTLDGFREALGGAPGDDPRGRAAFRVDDDRCRVVVVGLQSGEDGWELCRESFAGFSPDGRHVLSLNAVGDGLLVRDADDGDLVREIEVPGHARAYGWEGGASTLHVTVDEQDRTLVVRCAVAGGDCRPVASFPFVDRVPVPVPPA